MQASQRAAVAGALSAAFERGSAEPAAASLSMAGALTRGAQPHAPASYHSLSHKVSTLSAIDRVTSPRVDSSAAAAPAELLSSDRHSARVAAEAAFTQVRTVQYCTRPVRIWVHALSEARWLRKKCLPPC